MRNGGRDSEEESAEVEDFHEEESEGLLPICSTGFGRIGGGV